MFCRVGLWMLKRITIIGSGSWATALAKLFTDSGVHVAWLVRDEMLAHTLNSEGRNLRYLSSVDFDRSLLSATIDLPEACRDSELVLFAVPSAYLKNCLKAMDPALLDNIPVAVSIKSFVPGTSNTPGQFVRRYLKRTTADIIVLGGPCHAEEIANEKDTYLTVAGNDPAVVEKIRHSLRCHYVQAIASQDPLGIEYAAIIKNVIAIAAGIAEGLLYGVNFQSVLVSNAMREASDFIDHAVPGERDFFRSAYFGDLLVTAYSDLSRNRMLGKLVGRGVAARQAVQMMEMVAEGFYASKELGLLMEKAAVHAPILNTVNRILHKHANPFIEFKLLKEQLS